MLSILDMTAQELALAHLVQGCKCLFPTNNPTGKVAKLLTITLASLLTSEAS